MNDADFRRGVEWAVMRIGELMADPPLREARPHLTAICLILRRELDSAAADRLTNDEAFERHEAQAKEGRRKHLLEVLCTCEPRDTGRVYVCPFHRS